MLTEEFRELVERCRRGEQTALAALVEQFQDLVFGLCYRLLGHRQDAEDVAQDSFVRAIRSLDRWDPSRDFRPWLLTIAGNRCRSTLAARRRRPLASGELEDVPATGVHPPSEHAEELQRALAQLRDEYRRAFLLFHTHEMSYAEIAAALACPVGTAKTWVHRARRELAEHLRRRDAITESSNAMRRS